MNWTEQELRVFREQVCDTQDCSKECEKTKEEIDNCAEEILADLEDEWY